MLHKEANDVSEHEELILRLTREGAEFLNQALDSYIEEVDYSESTEVRAMRWAVRQMVEDFPVEKGSTEPPEAQASGS